MTSRHALLVAGMSITLLAALGAAASGGASAPPGSLPDAAPPSTESQGASLPTVEILEPAESYGGATRGEWDARWWQWAVSMPKDVNPNLDTTGERCGYGQSGPVFLLPGSFGGQTEPITCVVPEGTAIYATGGGSECSTVEPPPFFGRTEKELRACANAALDQATDFHLTVNGQDVGDLTPYRTTSPLFTFTFPEDNIFDVPPGVAQSVSAAYGVIILPPSTPGRYEIVGTTTYEGEPEPFTGTVIVMVTPPQVIEAPPPTTT